MDTTPWLTGQGITSFDLNNMSKDAKKGLARAVADILGATGTVVTDFAASQTTSPSMTINLTPGSIYQLAATDAEPIGTFAADSALIMQQGWTDSQAVALNASGLEAGQEKWWLIECGFEQVPEVRPGDPTNGLRGFWNSADPTNPLNGVDGLGGDIPGVIAGVANVTAIEGAPATEGAAVPPNPSSGCVPLFLVKVEYNQTTISTGQVMIAGTEAYDGYQAAPFLAGLLQSHHGGVPGQAPKINLATEVQGLLSYLNILVSNQTPPQVGGAITAAGVIPVVYFGNVDPTGNIAGDQRDIYINTVDSTAWVCIATGTNETAGWMSLRDVIPMKWSSSVETASFTVATGSGIAYEINASTQISAQLPPNPGDGSVFKLMIRPGTSGSVLFVVGSDGVGVDQIIQGGQVQGTFTLDNAFEGVVEILAMPGGWYVS